MTVWPEDLFEFSFISNTDGRIQDLAELCENEQWNYASTATHRPNPILFNYLRYTFSRLSEENKIEMSQDGSQATFNTGLVTPNQEPIYALFERNSNTDKQPWYLRKWVRRGENDLIKFQSLPEMAHYFDNPAVLVFDHNKELRANIEHIIQDNKERFPTPYREMENYPLQTFIKGALDNALERVKRNYKTAIPQYYRGRVQLLLPLCLSSPQKADLALVAEDHGSFYRASTCLTLDMAYNNARQLARPDRDWLAP